MSEVYAPTAPAGPITKVAALTEGGTGQTNAPAAVVALGGITAASINQVGGPLGLDAQGKLTIDLSNMPLGLDVAVTGPTSIGSGLTATYQITNFHAQANYVVSTANGSVSVANDIITYVAGTVLGTGGFVINGKTVAVTITTNNPGKPSVLTPAAASTTTGSTLSASSSAFVQGLPSDTHTSSDWELSTNSTFTTIVKSTYNDTTNKTTWAPTGLTANTLYYLRVRHKSSAGYTSDWSDVRGFSTKSSFTPANEEVVLGATESTTDSGYFGGSVVIAGDGSRVAVAAEQQNTSAGSNSGAVFIFLRTGTAWALEATLNGYAAGTNSGRCVAGDQSLSRVAIGCPGATSGGKANMGVVMIYSRTGTTWSLEQNNITLDGGAVTKGAQVGSSVAMDATGTLLVIGAPFWSATSGAIDQGAVAFFTRSGTTWTIEGGPRLYPIASTGASETAGACVAMSADGTYVVSSHTGYNGGKGGMVGWRRTASTWTQHTSLLVTDAYDTGTVGRSLSINSDGTVAAIAAPARQLEQGGANAGGVYIFRRTGPTATTWSQSPVIVMAAAAVNMSFGTSVSLNAAGTRLAASVPGWSSNRGAAILFDYVNPNWVESSTKAVPSSSAASAGGYPNSVALAATTFDRVLLGSPLGGSATRGRAFVFS